MAQPLGALLNIDVPDLEAAEAFYTRAFGLRRGRHFGDWMELTGLPVPVYLLPKLEGSATAPGAAGRAYERHWTPIHVDLVVADLELAVARAVQAGATLESAGRERPYGRIAMLGDPFGHGWCLIQFNDAGYDADA